ncbi:uncharacterized protein LOC119673331 [Teleopsis dalmanni]|uniref:uncharacterized protein LOC119673331 n=1 Tax=Teleopsis dalmanni TaxID=139649 RepID=UPI0018CF122F|nr:uncharacterized protein LOC119673331 [Teleopsis dalmanni]
MRLLIVFAAIVTLSAAAPQFGYGYAPNKGFRGSDNKYLPPATTTAAPLVHKQFYLISAPEDRDGIGKNKHLVIGRPQKNYRVVFIKAPSGDNNNVKLSAEYAPQEEKTVIYVLSKKDNDLDVNDIATPPPTPPSKPEIYFIKYKTPDEAIAAQKEIQDQYDRLGGTSEYSDEGEAPVTNIIGSLDGATPDGGYNYKQIQGGDDTPLSQYLPPAL